MLCVKDLSHSFEGREVLHSISFEVGTSEILAIMGSSGGGKTTLLKCISGLLKPTKGDVEIEGISVVSDPERARAKLGLVFQYAALFDYLNVSENVLFGIRRKKHLSAKQAKEIVSQRLNEVGLAGKENLMPNELSGGMRKRVGLARALAMEPHVLLYDEPTSGLDPVTAYSIDQLIVETRSRTQATSVVVSHDVSSVFRVADRIAFLHKGQLLFLGTPEEFRDDLSPQIKELVEKAKCEDLSLRIGI
ncbi:MAG: ATP-binding cassette domain-containing protein [Fimbriimonadaceae bacterium]|jgi:phospholipid/cholesterol/gamma-HCH transport system ATP-binding protein|nr:ATP-binding cassette domain-containing protein [Fimbriimonadaceae bacterium]